MHVRGRRIQGENTAGVPTGEPENVIIAALTEASSWLITTGIDPENHPISDVTKN